MKIPDLSRTPVVRKYGPQRSRRYASIWFAALYAALVALAAGLWAISPEVTSTWRRVVFGFIVAGLIITAASVLTRMRLEFFAGIELLEAKPKAA